MTADTREIAATAATPVVVALGRNVAAAWWPGPDRDAESADQVSRRPLPRGVEGHRVVNGRWSRREGKR